MASFVQRDRVQGYEIWQTLWSSRIISAGAESHEKRTGAALGNSPVESAHPGLWLDRAAGSSRARATPLTENSMRRTKQMENDKIYLAVIVVYIVTIFGIS